VRRRLAAATTALALALGALACSRPESVPTYVVERRTFRHQVTAEGILKAANVTPLTVPPEVEGMVRLAWLAPDGSRVEAGDVVARFDPAPMRDRLVEGQQELATVSFQEQRTEVESRGKVAELETKLAVADLELGMAERFKKVDAAAFSRHEIIESGIDQKLASERKNHAVEAERRQYSLSRTELELLAIRQRQARLKIEQAKRGLEALEVRAPHSGLLSLRRDWRGEILQVGSEMWQGQQLAEIPDLRELEAEVFVLEADAGGLAVGKKATVVVEARPDVVYAATIKRVDTVAKPRQRGSPVQYFGVTLAFDQPLSGTEIKPGHRVRATLILEHRDEALVVPRQAVVEEQGGYRVYLRDGDRFVPREVSIGATSAGLVEVTAGLAEGDEVALKPPASRAPDGGRRRGDGLPSLVAGG